MPKSPSPWIGPILLIAFLFDSLRCPWPKAERLLGRAARHRTHRAVRQRRELLVRGAHLHFNSHRVCPPLQGPLAHSLQPARAPQPALALHTTVTRRIWQISFWFGYNWVLPRIDSFLFSLLAPAAITSLFERY